MFYWMVPFVTDLTIGNDYDEYSIQNQMELLFSIKTGSFPLYAPGYALGHSSSALTLGEVFHPLSHVASILPGYWNGKALQWNTFLRLLSLGLAHLALFAFLRKIRLNTLFSFLLSCITVYNLRMLDMFRFGASLETYTGFLLLCAAIGWYFIERKKRIVPLSIIGATYLLVCSGHPTMMYYGLIGAGSFMLVTPFFLTDMLPDNQITYKDALIFYFKIGCYVTLGITLSSAYIFPFYFDFFKTNTLRAAQEYDPETIETLYGTLSNFFMPLFSDINYAFGSSSLFIMAAILPILRCFRIKIPNAVWVIWGMVLIAFLYMQGGRTPLYKWAWDYLPFVSSLRGEGRISLLIPILLMLLLAWIIMIKPFSFQLGKKSVTLTPYMLLALISLSLLLLFSLLSFLLKPALGMFPPRGIRNISSSTISILTFMGATSLVALISYGAFPRKAKTIGILLCLAACIQIGGILQFGTFIAESSDQPSYEQMKSQKKLRLDYNYNPGNGMYASVVLNHLTHSFLEPFLGKIYTQVIPVSSQDNAYEKMKLGRLPQQVFVERLDPEVAKTLTENAHDMREGTVNLVYSSFNRLQFRVLSEAPAIFGLSYPYTGHWNAWVNDRKVTVHRSNGAAHAVEIPKGESLIEFRYWSSAAFGGILISCAVLVLIGIYVCSLFFKGLHRVIAAVVVLIIGVGIVMLWNYSLYTGDNLNTKYAWTYTPSIPAQRPNLAYGKKTSGFPLPEPGVFMKALYEGSFYRTHWSKVVDGDRRSGFIMNLVLNPSVIIDLYQTEKINSIVLFESIKESSVNTRTIELSISQDEKQWSKVALISLKVKNHDPIRIEFDSPQTARFIQMKASGQGHLSLDEFEIY